MRGNKKEKVHTREDFIPDFPEEGKIDFEKKIIETIHTVPGFNDVFKKYREIEVFAKKIAEFMLTHGGKSLNIYDTGTEGIVLQIGTNDIAGGFLIKCSRSGYDIKKEIIHHKIFYKVFLEEKQKLAYVEMPHIVDDISDKFSLLIMDKLPGKTIWRLLIEHFFSPIFKKYNLDDTSDGDVRVMIENISEQIENQQGDPSVYINKGYSDDLEDEYKKHIQQKNVLYTTKNSFVTYKLMEDAKYRNIERQQDVDAIDILLEGNGKNVILGIKQFQDICKQYSISHNDLHSGNVMAVPQNDGSYKVGIIDFGKVSIPEK